MNTLKKLTKAGVFRGMAQLSKPAAAPKTFNYMRQLGALAILVLALQIISGVFLSMFYKPSAVATFGGYTMAFDSIERIMREINFGWLLRYLHIVGASALFIMVYAHLARCLYQGAYKGPRKFLWVIGVVLMLLMHSTAFFGYLLPWGQMSYWAATVIINIFEAIPTLGPMMSQFLRGGFFVSDPTVSRFFSLHYAFPMIIALMVGVHIRGLKIEYTVRHSFGLALIVLVYAYFVFFNPTAWGLFMEAENFSPANNLATPMNITPPWYLTPWYGILRAFPDKLTGVAAMVLSLLVLFFVPWLDRSKAMTSANRPLHRLIVLAFCASVVVLGYCGHSPMSEPLKWLGRIATGAYFAFFMLLPFSHRLDRHRLARLRKLLHRLWSGLLKLKPLLGKLPKALVKSPPKRAQ